MRDRNKITISNPIINARFSLPANGVDLIMLCLSNITKEDYELKEVVFDITKLEQRTNKMWNSIELRKLVVKLADSSILINTEVEKWEVFNWFEYFTYDKGICTCKLNSKIEDYLLMLERECKVIDIKYILCLNTSYTKRVYMMMKQMQNFGQRVMTVDEITESLKTPTSMSIVGHLKEKILDKAVKDINTHTDISISYTDRKAGKKIIGFKFSIKSNPDTLDGFKDMIKLSYTDKHLATDGVGKIAYSATTKEFYYIDAHKKINTDRMWNKLFTNRETIIKKLGEK